MKRFWTKSDLFRWI